MISPTYERLCGHTKNNPHEKRFPGFVPRNSLLQLGYHNIISNLTLTNLTWHITTWNCTRYCQYMRGRSWIHLRSAITTVVFLHSLCVHQDNSNPQVVLLSLIYSSTIIKLFIWSTPNCSPFFYCVNPYRLPHEVPPFPPNLQQSAVSSGIKWFLDESNCIYIAARVRVTKPTQIAHTKQVFY